MFDRSRTFVMALFGLRDQRNKKLPSSGLIPSINSLWFVPQTKTVFNGITGTQLVSPIFTVNGNSQPVELLWRRLSGTTLPIQYSKNQGSFVTAEEGTAFSTTFNSGDTLQFSCPAKSILPTSSVLRIENITDNYTVCSNNLTIVVSPSEIPGG